MPELTNYARYLPGEDEATYRPAMWCLECIEDDGYEEDRHLIWVQPDEEAVEPTLAAWIAVADAHEVEHHAAPHPGAALLDELVAKHKTPPLLRALRGK